MTRRLLGLETEYGFSCSPPTCQKRELGPAEALLRLAREQWPNLPAFQGNGCFLANGARFLIDTGGHPEIGTPEVDNPWDVVRYAHAGDRMMLHLAQALGGRGWHARAFKCNVDYTTRATWAAHENYSHRVPPAGLPAQLMAFLVSRIIFTGAGGLNPLSPGIEFCLSPRACHLRHPASGNSTSDRGIYHHKDESLAGEGWHRLHLICGESLCSHLGAYLKFGATALVLALAEAGLRPGEKVQLRDPVAALQAFNTDPFGRARAPLANGECLTALELQHHYLALAEAHLDHACMPSWAPAVCQDWRRTLEHFAQSPAALARSLDWAVKWALYHERLAARGITPQLQEGCNRALKQIARQREEERQAPPIDWSAFGLEHLLPPASLRDQVETFGPHLGDDAVSKAQLDTFLRLRDELCELEFRFGELGPLGLFTRLEAAGHLRHRLPQVDPESIQRAVDEPPSSGRARTRGQAIRSLAKSTDHACNWDYIIRGDGLFCDLRDPFLDRLPEWRMEARFVPDPILGAMGIDHLYEPIDQDYQQGRFQQARRRLDQVRLRLRCAGVPLPARHYHRLAWIACRQGALAEALAALDAFPAADQARLLQAVDHVGLRRYAGLGPGADTWDWVQAALPQATEMASADPFLELAFHLYYGYALARRGELAEAQRLLGSACARLRGLNQAPRLLAQGLDELSEAHRLAGDRDGALRCLAEAEQLQRAHHYDADLAERTLAQRAKVWGRSGEAAAALGEAYLLQSRLRHRMGLARTHVLMARLCSSRNGHQRRRTLLHGLSAQLPSLGACACLRKILEHWPAWTASEMLDGETDAFWGT